MKKNIILLIIILFSAGYSKTIRAMDLNEIEIHGFVSQGYIQSDRNNFLAETEDGTFQFNEMGINFSTDLTERLHLGIQFFSHDLGDTGNNEVIVDWAFADYHWKDWLGFRAGKIKKSLGIYNEIRDIDMLRPCILLPQGVYLDSEREALVATQGIGIYGNIPISFLGSLAYQIQYGTMNIDKDAGTAKKVEIYGVEVTGFDVSYVFDGAIEWSPFDDLRIKGSWNTLDMEVAAKTAVPMGYVPVGTPMTITIDDFRMYVLSIEYVWKELTVSGESLQLEMKRDIGFGPIQKQESLGCYLQASYRFNDWFEFGSYYSVFYADVDDKEGDALKASGKPDYQAWQKDAALSARFDLNRNWTFKLEGHSINGTALASSWLNPDDTDKEWFLFAAKMTFSF